MDIQFRRLDQVLVVTPVGSIDALTAEEIGVFLRTRIDAGHSRLVLDLSQVDFMSSSGIRVVMNTLKRTRQGGGDLHLAEAQPGIRKTLEISGLVRILNSYSSVEEALAGFEA